MADITEQVILRESLQSRKNRLNGIIESARLGTWEWDIKTGNIIINERCAVMTGYNLNEISPVNLNTWIRLAHPGDLKNSYEMLKKHFNRESGYYSFECRLKHKNGNWIWIWISGSVIERGNDGLPLKMFGTNSDITEKKELEDKIRELSIRDFLTNIYNRRYIFERLKIILQEFLREKKSFTISIVDIDHFKNINGEFGHQAGDYILKEFTRIIGENLRPYDLFGRFIYNNMEFKITFSCGISECTEHDADKVSVENIIEQADNRLYKAKNFGRNNIVISD